MQLAPKRNATAIRNKNGPRRIHSWNAFLVCANQAPLCFPLRLPIISPFFSFPLLRGLEAESPRRLEFGEIVPKGRRAGQSVRGTGRNREEHLLFPRLTYKVRFAHACMVARRRNNRLENCCRFVAHSSTGVPPAPVRRNFESS